MACPHLGHTQAVGVLVQGVSNLPLGSANPFQAWQTLNPVRRLAMENVGSVRVDLITEVQLRILVVDDSTDYSLALAGLIGSWGHEVALAHTGKAAVELARVFRPRVVFLDLGLPDMHGY